MLYVFILKTTTKKLESVLELENFKTTDFHFGRHKSQEEVESAKTLK